MLATQVKKSRLKPNPRKGRHKELIKGKLVACDTETTGLFAWKGDRPFAFSFCNKDGETACYEFPVDPMTRRVRYETNPELVEAIKAFFTDPTITKVFHNAKFDVRMIELAFGIKVQGRIEETMFMAHVCNTLESDFKLKRLSKAYLEIDDDDEKLLHRLTVKARRVAKKRGWKIADGGKDNVKADYWLPSIVFAGTPEAAACEVYATRDAERTMLLFLMYDQVLDDLDREYAQWYEEAKEEGQEVPPFRMACRETYELERELWPITYSLETRGVQVVPEVVFQEIKEFERKRDDALAFVKRAAWKGFDPDKPGDMRKLVYGKLKLPVLKRTDKSNQPATNVEALFEHMGNPVIKALFKYRANEKGLSSFFYKYRDNMVADPVCPGGMVLHCDFQQMGPVTGRFSCRNPNLQNVANALTTRSPEPIQARRPFRPRPGYVWYHVDYHQLEVVIFADVSQEPTMLAAIATGRDLHTECTNKAWGGKGNPAAIQAAYHSLELDGTGSGEPSEKLAEVWKKLRVSPSDHFERKETAAEQWLASFDYDIVKAEKSIDKKTSRAKAKMILFAKVFGGGPNAIKDLLHCTREEAQTFLNDYDRAFPHIVQYIKSLSRSAARDGYIVNRFGRRIAVDSDKPYRAVNYMVQGSAADLLKRSMIRCFNYLQETGLDAHLVLTIHDELVFEIKKEHAFKRVLNRLCDIMEDHQGHFGVPTPVEMEKCTERWNEKVKVDLGRHHDN